GTTTGAGREQGVSCAFNDMSGDVFYRWTAACNGTLTVDTIHPATNFATILSVYTGACGSLAGIGCGYSLIGGTNVSVPVTARLAYAIRVGGFPAAGGNFGLNVSSDPAPPSNDSCATPGLILGSGTFTGSTACATSDDPNHSCAFEASR